MNTKSMLVSVLALALASGCTLEETEDVDQYREAVPSAGAVAVDGPDTTGTSGRNAASGARGTLTDGMTAPAPAYWYTFTRDVRDGVNIVTAAILVTVSFVVHTEPSSVSEDEAVWGPFDGDALDPVSWRLTVTRIGDRQSPSHGDGSFTLDLDNSRRLDPSRHADDRGTVTIEHDLPRDIGRRVNALPRVITATVDPGTGESLVIGSTANTDHTGSLGVTAVVDIDDVKDGVNEDVSIASRWRETGAGRSDITIAGGSLPADLPVVNATECWGENFARVYYGDSIDFAPTEGDASLCAY
jgi:hypothetical protein